MVIENIIFLIILILFLIIGHNIELNKQRRRARIFTKLVKELGFNYELTAVSLTISENKKRFQK